MINPTIKHKNKRWSIGDKVNIGFVKDLTVTKLTSLVDGLPDIYTLIKGDREYEFIPHNGLHRIN